jgi:hypothetical protein
LALFLSESTSHEHLTNEEIYMARPIQPTPALKGQDAKTFVEKMNAAVMTPERLQYLRCAGEASKKAEGKKARQIECSPLTT